MRTRSRTQRGFTLIEVAVVAVIFAILIGSLLTRVVFYEEQSERLAVKQTLGILRSAMDLQMADRLLHPSLRPMSQLAGDNPMNWLAKLPPNYVGEYAAPKPGTITRGNWYFDTNDHTLIYLPTYGDHLQTAPGENGRLRFRVRLSSGNTVGYAANASLNSSFSGVVLEPVRPYQWF